MKSIKSILEMNKNDNVSLSLSGDDINNVLFALAYVYQNDDEADRAQREQYETLYTKIYKDVTKTLGKKYLMDNYGFPLNINKCQTRY